MEKGAQQKQLNSAEHAQYNGKPTVNKNIFIGLGVSVILSAPVWVGIYYEVPKLWRACGAVITGIATTLSSPEDRLDPPKMPKMQSATPPVHIP